MIRFLLRFIGLVCLAAAFILLIYDGTKSIAGNRVFLTSVRSLWELTRAGVKTATLRESLEQLAGWLPGLDVSLDQLRLFEEDGRLLVRLDDGQLVDPSGQRHFDFELPAAPTTALPKPVPDAESLRRERDRGRRRGEPGHR